MVVVEVTLPPVLPRLPRYLKAARDWAQHEATQQIQRPFAGSPTMQVSVRLDSTARVAKIECNRYGRKHAPARAVAVQLAQQVVPQAIQAVRARVQGMTALPTGEPILRTVVRTPVGPAGQPTDYDLTFTDLPRPFAKALEQRGWRYVPSAPRSHVGTATIRVSIADEPTEMAYLRGRYV